MGDSGRVGWSNWSRRAGREEKEDSSRREEQEKSKEDKVGDGGRQQEKKLEGKKTRTIPKIVLFFLFFLFLRCKLYVNNVENTVAIKCIILVLQLAHAWPSALSPLYGAIYPYVYLSILSFSASG